MEQHGHEDLKPSSPAPSSELVGQGELENPLFVIDTQPVTRWMVCDERQYFPDGIKPKPRKSVFHAKEDYKLSQR
ncbi:MAG TPA: hypothetical protein VMX16_05980 [Terriglobia bacterium]|nr:hypothetical protein [Terriglobia bacterium]